MADLGSIAVTCVDFFERSHVLPNPSYYSASIADMAPDLSGIIRGAITDNGVPVPLCRVFLMYRRSGRPVVYKRTDGNGEYEFTGLIPEALYAVIAQDVTGGSVYNDQIKSLTVPGS